MNNCPCGSGSDYAACCEPIITGKKTAETAEQLMRARYSAHEKVAVDFIFETTHPDHREGYDHKGTKKWAEESEWHGLEIVDIFPTVAVLTGGEIPATCEGRDLTAVLSDPTAAVRDFALSQYPRGTTMGYSLRLDRWRYTEWINLKTGEIRERELYDHRDSSFTDRNLIDDPQHAELIATLAGHLNAAERARRASQN